MVTRITVTLAILTLITSFAGLFLPATYAQETANWALQGKGQDIGNLFAVAILVISGLYRHRNSTKALVVWLGVLLYFMYAFTIYSFFLHFNSFFLMYVAALGISTYSFLWISSATFLKTTLDVKQRARFPASVLIGTAVLFLLLWMSEITPSLLTGTVPSSAANAGLWVNPVHVIDLAVVLPGMFLTGVLMLKQKKIGYFFAVPWLVFSFLMGMSILATLLLEYAKGGAEITAPFVVVGAVVVASAYATI